MSTTQREHVTCSITTHPFFIQNRTISRRFSESHGQDQQKSERRLGGESERRYSDTALNTAKEYMYTPRDARPLMPCRSISGDMQSKVTDETMSSTRFSSTRSSVTSQNWSDNSGIVISNDLVALEYGYYDNDIGWQDKRESPVDNSYYFSRYEDGEVSVSSQSYGIDIEEEYLNKDKKNSVVESENSDCCDFMNGSDLSLSVASLESKDLWQETEVIKGMENNGTENQPSPQHRWSSMCTSITDSVKVHNDVPRPVKRRASLIGNCSMHCTVSNGSHSPTSAMIAQDSTSPLNAWAYGGEQQDSNSSTIMVGSGRRHSVDTSWISLIGHKAQLHMTDLQEADHISNVVMNDPVYPESDDIHRSLSSSRFPTDDRVSLADENAKRPPSLMKRRSSIGLYDSGLGAED